MEEEIKPAFFKWFECQHGPQPHSKANHYDLLSQIKAGEIAATKLREIEDWKNRRESALFAWQASEAFHAESK